MWLKIKWSIITTITMGTSTILQKIAHWESTNHFGTDGVFYFQSETLHTNHGSFKISYLKHTALVSHAMLRVTARTELDMGLLGLSTKV